MFTYNLYTKIVESEDGFVPGVRDSIQHAPDAVVALFPFREPDTFSFKSQSSNPMGITQGEEGIVKEIPSGDIMKVSKPILLDSLVIGLSVQSAKGAHQDGMHLTMKDPNNNLLSLINPGDWIVCWMFEHPEDAQELRGKLLSDSPQLDSLNGFHSGLKFVGKTLAPRMQNAMMGDGSFIKTCTLQASAFSELDAQMYYDPYLTNTAISEFYFMSSITKLLNDKFNGIPLKVDEILGFLLAACLGNPPFAGGQSTPNSPMRVPAEIGRILGFPKAKNFMDILTAVIGIQKFEDSYLPKDLQMGLTTRNQATKATPWTPFGAPPSLPQEPSSRATIPFRNLYIHDNILSTGKPLTGAVFAQVQPFNNVPVWSILEQHLIPVANEMYSTLRYGGSGITPHLIMRQIPFNTDEFVSKNPSDYTAFRELPRWKVAPEMVQAYDVGKTAAARVNYVHVQVSGAIDDEQIQQAQRALTTPRWDSVDIARNGLKAFITQVNGTYEATGDRYGQRWTDMVTDRLIGSHLKLSGSIAITGVQQPICVGDNLEYDGFVFHIETIEHRLQVNPQSGHKTFSTHLAISNGVPAAGPALPEIGIRQFESTSVDAIELVQPEGALTAEQNMKRTTTSKLVGYRAPYRHTVVPSANVEED